MRIAVVEDHEPLAHSIAWRLRDRGHSVDLLNDGLVAEDFLAHEGADLVILDINLPGCTGLEVLSRLRRGGAGFPVLLLSARSDLRDRISGLDAGADDYLIKPFEMDELEARIRALLRRKNLDYCTREKLGGLEFDRTSREVFLEGKRISLPRRETAVLECLLDRCGQLVSKARLIDHVYGVGAGVDDRAIEPHISRLRGRLKACHIAIRAARGLGYMIEIEQE